ncbi:ABC transporter permease [Pontibacillus yanchengensis]|uniref:ABC transporter permease n=1 Tax=Pontibacillus yanchengensis TaxID=462910 RepID=UPI0009FFD893|nr:ABC transporter permease subunit [Pontibacillus yanchengensis]
MIWSMFKKEMTDAFRDKRTMLLTFLIPVAMLTALVFFYESMLSDNSNTTYTVAIPHELSEEGEQFFAELPTLKPNVTENAKQAVEEGEATVAFLSEEAFFDTVTENQVSNVTLYGDSTSENASTVMSLIENQLNTLEDSIVSSRLANNNLNDSVLEAIQIERQQLSYNDNNGASTMILAMFLPMIFAISIASGGMPVSADILAGEKERKTMEALLMTPVSRKKILVSKWFTISTIGFLSGITALIIVVIETFFFTENLKDALGFGEQLPLILMVVLCTTILFSLFIGALQLLVSLVSKTVKESNNYGSPIIMLTVFPVFLIMSKGVNEFTFTDYITPFMNMFVLLKEMLLGVLDPVAIFLTLGSTALYMLIAFVIAQILFMKDKWVL